MAISVVGYASSAGAATTLTVTKANVNASLGGTVTDGDLLVAVLHTDWGTLPAAPGGWTSQVVADGGSNAPHLRVMTHTAASEGASWVFSTTGGDTPDSTLTIVCLRGATATGSTGSGSVNTGTLGGTVTAPSVDHDGTSGSILLCGVWCEDGAGITYSPPAGMTEIADVQSGVWTATSVAYLANTPDPSSTRVFTTSPSGSGRPGGMWSYVLPPIADSARAAVSITPFAATNWVTGTTPVSATYPASLAENDIIYLICSSKPGGTAPTTPTNWTLVGSTQVGSGSVAAGTGPTQVTVFRRVAGPSPPSGSEAVTLTGSNVMSVCMQSYRASGVNLQWETEPWWTASAAASTTPALAATVATSAVTTKDVVAWVVSVTDDSGTDITHTSETLTGITFGTDARFPDDYEESTTGNDLASAAFYVPITAGPNSGTTLTLTENITASETSGTGVFRIRATADVISAPMPLRRRPERGLILR